MASPYDSLPEVPSFEVASTDVTDGEAMPLPQVSGIFGAGGEDMLSATRPGAGFHRRRRASSSPATTPTRQPRAASGTGRSSTSPLR